MGYEELRDFIQELLNTVTREQEKVVAYVASHPNSDLSTVRFEAGKLHGMGGFVSRLDTALKDHFSNWEES